MDVNVDLFAHLFPPGTRFVTDAALPLTDEAGPFTATGQSVLVADSFRGAPTSYYDNYVGVVMVNPRDDAPAMLQVRQLVHVLRFVALPRAPGTTMLLPRDLCKLFVGAALQDRNWPKRAARILMALAAAAGFRIFGDRITVATREPLPIVRWLCETFRTSQVTLALTMGSPGAFQKATLEVIDGTGTVRAFVKRALHDLARASLRNENFILRELAARSPTLKPVIPAVISSMESEREVILLLSAGPDHRGSGRFGMEHVDFLKALAGVGGPHTTFAGSPQRMQVARILSKLSSVLERDYRELFATLVGRLDATFSDEELRLQPAHRDFAPWNTLRTDHGRLFVLDWEAARLNWSPLHDLFHFFVLPAILAGRQTRHYDRHALTWNRCAALLGVPRRLVVPLYGAYLLDTASHYLEARHAAPERGDDRVLKALTTEIREMLSVFELKDR